VPAAAHDGEGTMVQGRNRGGSNEGSKPWCSSSACCPRCRVSRARGSAESEPEGELEGARSPFYSSTGARWRAAGAPEGHVARGA
jgi:hypothetical protein